MPRVVVLEVWDVTEGYPAMTAGLIVYSIRMFYEVIDARAARLAVWDMTEG